MRWLGKVWGSPCTLTADEIQRRSSELCKQTFTRKSITRTTVRTWERKNKTDWEWRHRKWKMIWREWHCFWVSHITQGQGRGSCSSPEPLPRHCSSYSREPPLLPEGDTSNLRLSSAACFFPPSTVSRSYDTTWKRRGEMWWSISPHDLPSAESTDNKSRCKDLFLPHYTKAKSCSRKSKLISLYSKDKLTSPRAPQKPTRRKREMQVTSSQQQHMPSELRLQTPKRRQDLATSPVLGLREQDAQD